MLTRVQVPPEAYEPRRPQGFRPRLIVLTRGARATLERARLVERICRLYPRAERREAPRLAHNRVEIGAHDPLEMHYRGKRTLVFGEHRSAVRLSEERGNTCPNYWHFTPYGFCPYDCKYCYLAATQGVRFSPTVKVFLNLPCNVVVTGHLEATKNEVSGAVSYRFMTTGKAETTIPLEFDDVWVADTKKTSKGVEYQLITARTGAYLATTRIGRGKFETFEKPDIAYLLKKAGRDASNKPLLTE